jgi:hypothetical protein
MYRVKDISETDANLGKNQACRHLFYSLNWLDVLKSTYHFEAKVILDDKENLQLIFCPVNDVRGMRIINLPFSDYTPSCGLTAEDYNQLLSFLKQEYPNASILFKTTLAKEAEVEAKISRQAVGHHIQLNADIQSVQSSSFIRNTKKAINEGLNVRETTSFSAIRTFYDLYHQLRFKKFNSIPQPFPFFENIWLAFIKKSKGIILEVLNKENVIASLIALEHGDTVYYKFGCSDEDNLDKRPNNLLFSHLIERSKKKGFQKIDLGLSGTSDSYKGLRRWKESMGGQAFPITYWLHVPSSMDKDKEEKVLKNLNKFTNAIIEANLSPKQTSAFSEKIYPLFA